MTKNNVGDFYWAYADVLRSVGIQESVYDERILAFMGLKLLIDNDKVNFNFIYKDDNENLLDLPFGLKDNCYIVKNNNLIDYKKTFENIIENISFFDNTLFFVKERNGLLDYQKYNLNKYSVDNELDIFKKVFDFKKYINELSENKFLEVLDIYNTLANFKGYPRHKYKNLYENTITRMKKLSGALTGQHFTQTSIINLMTKLGTSKKNNKEEIFTIYDPTCGVGSMLYDAAFNLIESKSIKKQNNIYLLGQEVNGPTWFLAKVFAEISNFKNFIAFGNTLTDPVLPLYMKSNKLNFIIANPPFGVDWKTDKSKIEKMMLDGILNKENKTYYTIIKKNNQVVTPKITDAQWLFFLHIANALELNKECKALVLSSTSLLSNGSLSSEEGIIRSTLIKEGFVETVIEQPNGMFTNTDIKTHLWVLDKKNSNKNNVQIIKIDNDFINKPFKDKRGKQLKSIKVLFDKAIYQIDKQKNGYSDKNIENIFNIYSNKQDLILFSKKITKFNKDYSILFENYFNINIDQCENFFTDFETIKKTERSLSLVYELGFYENQEIVEKILKIINGEIFSEEEFYTLFVEFYFKLFDNLNNKDFISINSDFEKEYSKLKESIIFNLKDNLNKLWNITGVNNE